MQPLYDLKTPPKLEPREYKLIDRAMHLLPVPRDNAVGTNDFNNAISLIRFRKDRVVYDEIARDFFKYKSGGELSFMPVFDNNVVGYGQSRRFVRVDLETAKIREHRICYPLEETIQRIAISNVLKEHFLFQIEKFAKDTVDTMNYKTLLRLMDLSGKEPVLLKERELPRGIGWLTAYNHVFLYDTKMAAFTLDLEPSHHKMVDVVNSLKLDFRIYQIHPHATFSFTIITGRHDLVVSWNNDNEIKQSRITDGNTQSFEFSPDGRWVVFKDEETLGNFKYYLMPVSNRYSFFLGSPILLFEGNFLATCWTTNPISFVGSTGSRLRRWELTSQAYPQAGRMDLHDYFVQRDLEKLKAQEGAK